MGYAANRHPTLYLPFRQVFLSLYLVGRSMMEAWFWDIDNIEITENAEKCAWARNRHLAGGREHRGTTQYYCPHLSTFSIIFKGPFLQILGLDCQKKLQGVFIWAGAFFIKIEYILEGLSDGDCNAISIMVVLHRWVATDDFSWWTRRSLDQANKRMIHDVLYMPSGPP